jgi:hypothetical protein
VKIQVEAWVGMLMDNGVPAERISWTTTMIGKTRYARVKIYSGHTDKACHWTHREKWYDQHNEKTLAYALTWYNAHKREEVYA